MHSKLANAKSVLLFCMLLFSISAFSQKKITGKVTDQTSKPLAGITINAKGTKVNVITSENGDFTIEVPAKVTTLRLSSVGFESKDVSIEGK